MTFISATLFFIGGLVFHPLIYSLNVIATLDYYLYAYSSLNQYSALRVISKACKFAMIMVLIFFAAMALFTVYDAVI